jgi:hypothetical protein
MAAARSPLTPAPVLCYKAYDMRACEVCLRKLACRDANRSIGMVWDPCRELRELWAETSCDVTACLSLLQSLKRSVVMHHVTCRNLLHEPLQVTHDEGVVNRADERLPTVQYHNDCNVVAGEGDSHCLQPSRA